MSFPDSIGAIVCGKKIWDSLITFLTRIDINNDTYKRLFDLVDKASSNYQTTNTNNSSDLNIPPYIPNTEDTMTDIELNNTEAEDITPDEGLIKVFQSDYAKLKEKLNATLSHYNTSELRQNTEKKEDYDTFVDLRKDLTTTYISGQHLLKQLQEFEKRTNKYH